MSTDPEPRGGSAAPVFVEDLFLTDAFLIKGCPREELLRAIMDL